MLLLLLKSRSILRLSDIVFFRMKITIFANLPLQRADINWYTILSMPKDGMDVAEIHDQQQTAINQT